MSNGLSDQLFDDQDESWRSEQNRHLARKCYQPLPPVDQSTEIAYRPTQPADQSNVIPTAIAVCWYPLKQSHLSEEAFRRLISAASSRVTRSGEGFRPLNAESLSAFLQYWDAIRTIAAEPEIAISPKGKIQAEWTKDEGNFLVLEFQPSGEIYFSLWQDGYPTEGVKSAKRTHELINMFGAMDENPLS